MWEQPGGTGDGDPAITVAAVRMFCGPLVFSPNLETSVIAQLVKNLPTMQETLVRFLGQEDMLEKG